MNRHNNLARLAGIMALALLLVIEANTASAGLGRKLASGSGLYGRMSGALSRIKGLRKPDARRGASSSPGGKHPAYAAQPESKHPKSSAAARVGQPIAGDVDANSPAEQPQESESVAAGSGLNDPPVENAPQDSHDDAATVIADGETALYGEKPDLLLEDVQLVDPGSLALNREAVYRIVIRNAGAGTNQPFDVAMLPPSASPSEPLPPITQRVDGLSAGQTLEVDLRAAAVEELEKLETARVVVVLDSRREVDESDESNNAARLEGNAIGSIRPRVTAIDHPIAAGMEITLDGEGFGEAPGEVFVNIRGLKLATHVSTWSRSSVTVRLPEMQVDQAADATLILTHGDGRPAEPRPIVINPATSTKGS